MRRIYIFSASIFLLLNLLATVSLAQVVREEKEEKVTGIKKFQVKPPVNAPYFRVGVFSGYDSNAELTPLKKGDIFEEFLLSAGFNKPLMKGLKFTFDYDLDFLNYNEYRDVSTLLNHFRFGLHQRFAPFTVGTGYDLGIFYYPHSDDDNFFAHKGFAYLRQDITKNLYHKLQAEYLYKDYTDRKALANTLFTYQDKDLFNKRYILEYSVGTDFIPKLFVLGKMRFSDNDANANFQNFYDYKAYYGYLGFDYTLLARLHLLTNCSYERKNYNKRRVTLSNNREKDNLYTGNVGLRYMLNKNNAATLYYTYRDNDSNEHLEQYRESVFSAGWQYIF